MQVTDRPSPHAPSLTQAIIVQMVYTVAPAERNCPTNPFVRQSKQLIITWKERSCHFLLFLSSPRLLLFLSSPLFLLFLSLSSSSSLSLFFSSSLNKNFLSSSSSSSSFLSLLSLKVQSSKFISTYLVEL